MGPGPHLEILELEFALEVFAPPAFQSDNVPRPSKASIIKRHQKGLGFHATFVPVRVIGTSTFSSGDRRLSGRLEPGTRTEGLLGGSETPRRRKPWPSQTGRTHHLEELLSPRSTFRNIGGMYSNEPLMYGSGGGRLLLT